jgi:uncharacterized Fe-S cluster-containing radical SAM superfamily protein
MIDPIELSKLIETHTSKYDSKKYYRFRKTQFYGGCATADCVGCNLRCIYCWAQKKVWHPTKYGKFYTPEEVSNHLLKMDLSSVRVSGGEPTIGKEHLLRVIELIPEDITFILETNGLLLDVDYVKELSKFKNLYVRVSLKGVDEESFRQITGAEGKYFTHQLEVLKLLSKYNIPYRPALLYELFNKEQINNLGLPDIEFETLMRYPFVMSNLRKEGIEIKNIK